jgi:hypothetical protein
MSLGTTLKIGFDAQSVDRGLKGLSSKMAGFAGGLAKAGVATIGTALAAAGFGAIAFAKAASQSAAETEALASQFETLLGSASAAKDRMEEITQFAATTPFEIKELASTSKMLEVVAGEMLSTGKGLRMVGDAAALANQPIEEVGLHIGRMFQAMTSGTSAGESVNRLQELGLISGQAKRNFQELAEQQKRGKTEILSQEQAYQMLSDAMSKSKGSMEKLAATTQGKLSNLRDNLDQLKVSFGTGFNDGLKVALDAVNVFLPKFQEKMKLAGQFVGKAISEAVSGDYSKFILIGEIIAEGIKLGMKTGLSKIGNSIRNADEELGIEFFDRTGLGEGLSKLVTGDADNWYATKSILAKNRAAKRGSIMEEQFNSSDMPMLLDELNTQINSIKVENQQKDKNQLAQSIAKLMYEEFSPGGPKMQVSLTKAVSILMNIEKKLNPNAPAKM